MNYLYFGIAIVVFIVIIYYIISDNKNKKVSSFSNEHKKPARTAPATCTPACTGVLTCSGGTCVCDTKQCPAGCTANGTACAFSCDSCPPYNCSADSKSCLSSCTGPTDTTNCVTGSKCIGTTCVTPQDVSTCGFYNYTVDSNGLPHCITQCASTSDCRSPASCIAGVCTPPGLMTAAECAACPSGACNSANTACVLPPPDGKWEGWATTTQFGQGEGTWPGSSWPALNLCNGIIGDPTRKDLPSGQQALGRNTMGGAIPTGYVATAYGSRTEWLNSIIKSANTPITDPTAPPACYEIQPLSVYPNQLSGGADDWLQFCKGTDCKDINDPTIGASYTGAGGATTEYPTYLIVPYEFCGGNCATNEAELATNGLDCFNSCTNIQELINGFGTTTGGQYCDISNLMAANRWDATQYMDEITPLNLYGVGIASPDYGTPPGVVDRAAKTGARLNWCSGQNMHFDIAQTTPLWLGGLPGDTNPPPATPTSENSNLVTTTGDSQIVVRYRRVPCNKNGQFDVSAPPPGYASGIATSTTCYDSNGKMQFPPPGDGGTNSPKSLYCASTSTVCANGAPVDPPVVYGCAGWGASQGTFVPDAAFVSAQGTDPTKWTSWPTSGVCQGANGCVMDINGNCSTPGGGGNKCAPGLGSLDCASSNCTGCILAINSADSKCGGQCLPTEPKAACAGPTYTWCGS